jgi:hypothetical protein
MMKFKRKYNEDKEYVYDYKIVYLKQHVFDKIKKMSTDEKITISQVIDKLNNFYEKDQHSDLIG